MRIGESASLARGTKRPAAPTRSPSEPRSDCTDVPEVPACKRSSRVRTPAAKVLSMILPEPSTAHDPAKADASALVDAATAVATDDINLTSTGSISQFLKGLEQLDDGDEDSPAAMRRITSYTTQHNACADAGSVDGSSSDTDSGSFSNDNSSSMLVSPPPTHALVVGGGMGSTITAGDAIAADRSSSSSSSSSGSGGGSSSSNSSGSGGGGGSDGLSRTASLDACFDDGRGVACKDEAVANRKDWAAWEDEAIRTGVHTIGTRWRQIAADLPGRSDDAVRNRWARLQHSLSGAKLPALPRVKRVEGVEQRQSWTEEEDEIISSSVRDFGHRWNRIAERLPRRTEHAIRNRWHRIQMREYEEKQGGAHHGAMPPSAQGLAMLAEMQAPPTTTPPTTAPPRAKPADATPTTAPHLAPSLTSASAASSVSVAAALVAAAAASVTEAAAAAPLAPLPGRVTKPAPAADVLGAVRCDSLDVDGVTTAFCLGICEGRYLGLPGGFDVDDMLVCV